MSESVRIGLNRSRTLMDLRPTQIIPHTNGERAAPPVNTTVAMAVDGQLDSEAIILQSKTRYVVSG